MTKHEQLQAGCEGKQAFASRAKAKEVAKRMRRGGRTVGEYRCEFCGRWHIGQDAKRQISTWEPRKHQDRPTPERRRHGEWVFVDTEAAGHRVARDMASTPIDRMEHAGVLSNEQASAARDFEQLYRAAQEVPATRDSCTIWEPQGHDESDGPVEAVRDRRELYLFLGTQRDMILRYVCVEHREPRPRDIGLLREALNECVRFFK